MIRRGVSLIEVLVVVAIIAVLVGLILPAVQKVRSASLRSTCQNQLRQLGLALQHHHDAQQRLPAGCTFLAGKHPEPHMSWLTRLLPYVEQAELYAQAQAAFRQEKFFELGPHLPILAKFQKGFVCPADARAQVLGGNPASFQTASTSYLGNAGRDYSTRDGLFFVDSAVRFADISDGLSNTLAAGERPPDAQRMFGWWYAGWGQDRDGSAEYLLGVRERRNRASVELVTCEKGPYHFGPPTSTENCDLLHYWSEHPGGGHFLFADGAVRFVAYAGDDLLPALATRGAGEAAVLP